jgi:tRNA threonylcarbamoyladenosine biosynthesis protein TsaB
VSLPCGLAIEAATDQLGVAACRGARTVLLEARPARDETQRIYEHAARVLQDVGAALHDLEFVAFGCGPGSFTGVRIAAAAAQAIGFARDIPVCRVSSLAVLAAGAGVVRGSGRLVVACLDARMERAYIGAYRVMPEAVEVVVPDAWIDPAAFELPGDEPFVAVGDGWAAHPRLAERHRARVANLDAALLPSARDLLSMALRDFRAGRTWRPEEALPEYLGQVPALARSGAGEK